VTSVAAAGDTNPGDATAQVSPVAEAELPVKVWESKIFDNFAEHSGLGGVCALQLQVHVA